MQTCRAARLLIDAHGTGLPSQVREGRELGVEPAGNPKSGPISPVPAAIFSFSPCYHSLSSFFFVCLFVVFLPLLSFFLFSLTLSSFHPSSLPLSFLIPLFPSFVFPSLSLSLSPPPIQFVATAAAARETSARGLEGLKRYWHDGVCGFGRQLAQVEANLLHAELREQDGVRPMQDHTATKILYTERYSKDSKEK